MADLKKPINSVTYSPNELSLTINTNQSEFNHLSSREVLVEVLTVALDQWDLHLICSMGASSRTIINPHINPALLQHHHHHQNSRNSIVPGRSFFGKVLEVGKAVKKLKRGELVYGLQELSKSGALSGRIKISSDFVARAPALGKCRKECSNGSNSGSSTATIDNRNPRPDHWAPVPLSSIEIASLPLLAVPAALIASTVCEGMPKGSKMLILNGHKGIGRMIVQLMRYFRPSRDLWISVHVPCTAAGNLVELEELVEQIEEEGATEVITSESVLELLHGQHESSFDVVLDTIGGQRIYDGSRRLLHHSGMFVTTIGPASTTSLSKSRFFRLRSLKRHFFKKDTKMIRYWQVTPADGFDGAHPEEIRTVLETISEWLSETALASLGRRSFSIGRRISGPSISTSEALHPTSQAAVIVSTSRNERTGKKETRKTTGRRLSVANNQENQQSALRLPTKPVRSYPIRKQFIFESYLDLFTTNQVCLLFRHQGLTCREWNSIRGKIKNLSSSSSTTDTTPIPFGEFKFEEPSVDDPLRSKTVPRIQVLRTKMILPVLKNLLKQSKITRKTYDSLVYSAGSPKPLPPNSTSKSTSAAEDKKKQRKERKNLNGSLFSLSQADFDPSHIKQALEIIAAYGPDPNQQQEASKKPAGSINPNQTKEKINFMIGFIDRSICKDASDLQRFSSINSLETSRSQIIGIISRFSSDLLFTLNQARASQLVHTLQGFQKTLEDQAQQDHQLPTPNQPSPDQPTSKE